MLRKFSVAMNPSTILLVEDDTAIREVLAQALELEDYRPIACTSGQRALEVLKSLPQTELPALILLDLMMPDIDGVEFTQLIRAKPEWSKIPVVLLTASTRAEQIAAFLKIPCLKKPIELDSLFEVIGRYAARSFDNSFGARPATAGP
jgi:CheY-like chemotaxis protein